MGSVGSTSHMLLVLVDRRPDQAAHRKVPQFQRIPAPGRLIPAHHFTCIHPRNYSPLCVPCVQDWAYPATTASEVVASLRWWAKWTTPTSRTATFTSERFSHQVRWMPDPPATFSVPFSRSRSTSSAHIVRLVCLSVSQELQSGRTWTASTFYCGSMAGPSRPLKLRPSPPCPQAAVAREASRLRRPSRGPRGRSRRLAGPRKGREAAGVSRPRPRERHAHCTPCPRTSRMLRWCR